MGISKYGLLFFILFMDIAIFGIMAVLPLNIETNGAVAEASVGGLTNMWYMITFQMPGAGVVAGMWWTIHGLMIASIIMDWVRGIGS